MNRLAWMDTHRRKLGRLPRTRVGEDTYEWVASSDDELLAEWNAANKNRRMHYATVSERDAKLANAEYHAKAVEYTDYVNNQFLPDHAKVIERVPHAPDKRAYWSKALMNHKSTNIALVSELDALYARVKGGGTGTSAPPSAPPAAPPSAPPIALPPLPELPPVPVLGPPPVAPPIPSPPSGEPAKIADVTDETLKIDPLYALGTAALLTAALVLMF